MCYSVVTIVYYSLGVTQNWAFKFQSVFSKVRVTLKRMTFGFHISVGNKPRSVSSCCINSHRKFFRPANRQQHLCTSLHHVSHPRIPLVPHAPASPRWPALLDWDRCPDVEKVGRQSAGSDFINASINRNTDLSTKDFLRNIQKFYVFVFFCLVRLWLTQFSIKTGKCKKCWFTVLFRKLRVSRLLKTM